MPFAPVDPAIKEKVIAAYLADPKKGRNQITREMHEQGVQVSHGSVSNILNVYKRKHGIDGENTTVNDKETPTTQSQDHKPLLPILGSAEEVNVNQAEEEEKQRLSSEAQLLMVEIGERRQILTRMNYEVKAKTKDFLALKDEMSRYGIDLTSDDDSPRFLNVINAFRRYGYDPSKIMNAFADVQDLMTEKKNVERLKSEAENDRRAFQRILDTLGISLDGLKAILTSLMTLDRFGVSQDMIINLSRKLQESEPGGRGWSPNISENNGGGQGQDYTGGYNNY
jgi:hypothetical protein